MLYGTVYMHTRTSYYYYYILSLILTCIHVLFSTYTTVDYSRSNLT